MLLELLQEMLPDMLYKLHVKAVLQEMLHELLHLIKMLHELRFGEATKRSNDRHGPPRTCDEEEAVEAPYHPCVSPKCRT